MKKQIFLFLLLLTSSLSKAQFFYGDFCLDCYASIEAGGIYSNISGLENSSGKTGFYFGFYQFFPIDDQFSFRSGLSYNNIGAEVDGFDTPLIIHSINFPLSLHYRLKENYQFFGGGEFGTNLFGKYPQRRDEYYDSFDNQMAFNENFTFLDVSAFLGVGYIISDNIDFNLKYNLGLTSINKEDIFRDNNWKKNWLTLSVGYTFRD
ncbi:outer membrane beta-barrel protein [Flavobacterium urocaniciphilum]|uniref:Outer membrane protein beta-barrel domain-containing protein n=1 Tax=Flavobacterium urocaniciphilum TaxID=1299341 RepID=A0A1H8YUP9_9FLAO|nr:outer membrane beta-barrel protein [Flavobacterium urocaniciphilum]SEP55098.1 Outer membrane protein beta-barrel domain-containing protein [Flavobacterium urocaniciphilum]